MPRALLITCTAKLSISLALLCQAAATQPQFRFPGKEHVPAIGETIRSIAFEDVDRDGDVDIFLAADRDRLLVNDGHGVFTDATKALLPTPIGSGAQHAVFADVDGDGDPDLALAGGNSPDRLYLNDGRGRFHDRTAGRLPFNNGFSVGIDAADVDGDRDLDLVVARSTENSLFLNDGTGRFGDATAQLKTTSASNAARFVDVDADGDPDLVLANFRADQLLKNDGKGTFTLAPFPGRIRPTSDLVVGDLDGKNGPDLLFLDSFAHTMFLNDGKGRFVAGPGLPFHPEQTQGASLADIDGDRDLDVLLAVWGQPECVFLNDGTAKFTEARDTGLPSDLSATLTIATADVDSDTDLDIVTGHLGPFRGGHLMFRLFLNDSRGRYVDASARGIPQDRDRTRAALAGDIDGDGDPDVIFANASGQSRALLNDGHGRLVDATRRLNFAMRASPTDAELIDIDGDLDLDIVLADDKLGRLWTNDGRGHFRDDTSILMPTTAIAPNVVVALDVESDGDLDLVFGNRAQDTLYVNNGVGRFTDATSGRIPAFVAVTNSIAVGDVDGDRDPDLVLAHQSSTVILLNDGKGVFSASAVTLPAANLVALGNPDGDSDLDLFLITTGSQFRIYTNDGHSRFTDETLRRVPTEYRFLFSRALRFADLDEDGDEDVVLAEPRAAGSIVLYNDGTGHFVGTRLLAGSANSRDVVVDDFDGDGDLDLVFAEDGPQNLYYVNTARQTTAPFVARLGRPYTLRIHAWPRSGAGSLALPFLNFRVQDPPALMLPMGRFYLPIAGLVILPPIQVGAARGFAESTLPMPRAASLIGLPLHAQSLVVELTPLARARFTNLNSDTLIR